jgi:hypothetical protein
MKVTERIKKQFAVVFANEHRANFFICCVPALFPVLECPIRSQRVRAKQAGHFSLFNCPTLK